MNTTNTDIAKNMYHDVRRAAHRSYTTLWTPRSIIAAHRAVITKRLPCGLGALREQCAKAVARARKPEHRETLADRFSSHLAEKWAQVVASRGGETNIEGNVLRAVDHQAASNLTLLRASGWREYSGRFGSRHAEIAYLCGIDDNGSWAVRVPGSTRTIEEALAWRTPAAVRKALTEGKRVLRQGDFYFVEQRRDNLNALDRTSHSWDPQARIVSHTSENPHQPLHLPFPAKAIPQKPLRMGRTTGRGAGD